MVEGNLRGLEEGRRGGESGGAEEQRRGGIRSRRGEERSGEEWRSGVVM